jgi:L-ascorbate metabolism protein UlaG (beta-lactamase superfamily)
MKIDRRDFIKRCGLAAAGAAVSGPMLRNEIKASPKVKLNYKPEPDKWKNDAATLAWIGHSTVLINLCGKWIVTDPVLSDRVGVGFFGAVFGPARLTPPALVLSEFPKPDLIVVSHAHMDHMDYPTLKSFAKKYPDQIDIVVAYLTKDVIDDLPWKSVTMLDWNQEAELDGIRVRANEVKHFGARYPWEKDRSRGYLKGGRSYNAYLLERNGKKILFGGDMAFSDKLLPLKNENIDVAIMPIGAYNPWHHVHANPEEALQMADQIGAKYFCPIHTKTFTQSVEPFNEPIDWMKRSAPNYKLHIGWEEIGQTFVLPETKI